VLIEVIVAASRAHRERHEAPTFRLDQVMASRGNLILALEKVEGETSKRRAGPLRVWEKSSKVGVPRAEARRGQPLRKWRAGYETARLTVVSSILRSWK
jgi:hypothetical protein